MFSGVIGHRGTVVLVCALEIGGLRLGLRCDDASDERVEPKDSIAINGVCLTVTAIEDNQLDFDVVPETLARSTLGTLEPGDLVNVEFSLRLGDRMGGHFVYGHVDATGAIVQRTREGQGERLQIEVPPRLAHMICEKAFVSIDGVSLTVAAIGPGYIEIALIPETLARTTLGARRAGDRVNLEVDPLARYAAAAVELGAR